MGGNLLSYYSRAININIALFNSLFSFLGTISFVVPWKLEFTSMIEMENLWNSKDGEREQSKEQKQLFSKLWITNRILPNFSFLSILDITEMEQNKTF